MKVFITRTYLPNQTLGKLAVISNGMQEFGCKTLERPWLDNAKNESCIPAGKYTVVKRSSEKYPQHFHILNVPARGFILIHNGNYTSQSKGCILVGSDHADINKDGMTDVINSKETLKTLYGMLPDKFELEIL